MLEEGADRQSTTPRTRAEGPREKGNRRLRYHLLTAGQDLNVGRKDQVSDSECLTQFRNTTHIHLDAVHEVGGQALNLHLGHPLQEHPTQVRDGW